MLRGDYKQSDYGKVILPFTLLRRLDCVLAPTRDKVLAEQKKRRAQKVPAHEFLLKTVNVPMAINPDLKALIPGSRIDSGFLAWALRGTMNESMRRTEEAGHGTKALRMGAWTSMPLPVPPIDEQLRIVDATVSALTKLDLLFEKAAKSVTLSKEHRSALISAAVTGKVDVREAV